MQFTYRAKDATGKEVKGTLRAPNEKRAVSLLRSNNLVPFEVKLARSKSLLSKDILARVGVKDMILFSRQLASMIRAGVPILAAIKALVKQVDSTTFRDLLDDIAYDIEGGESLTNALAKHPSTFNMFYLGVVRTGEASGNLSDSLDILGDYLEQNYIFNRKVRSALMYPAFVITVVIIVAMLMLIFVMPQLVSLFSEANVALPLPTQVLILVTGFIKNYWYAIVLFLIALVIILRSYLKTPEGQYTASSIMLRTPLLSVLFKRVYLARLTTILHTLFSSNVPIIESLEITKDSIGNKVYETIIGRTLNAVKDGSPISSVWEHEHFIPPMLTTMVSVGERSGEISNAFLEAHGFFKRDVEEILGSITVFVEPVLVIILAIGVGFIVAAVLLPIYNLVLVL